MIRTDPVVSVVIAAYSTKQEYFQESIESILRQTLRNFELIVVDDGLSEENRSYLARLNDSRLKVLVNEKNVGQSISVNKGISISQGKYIARMDSDDIATPNRLSSQVSYMESHPECIACGGFAERTDNHKIVPVNYPDIDSRRMGFFWGCDMIHPTMMIRRSSLSEFGIRYDENQRYAQDYMIWIDFMLRGEIGIVPDVVLRYRIHPGQITAVKRAAQDEYAVRAQKKLYKQFGFNIDSIDFYLHNRIAKYDVKAPLSKIVSHLQGLVSQAKHCLSRREMKLFKKEVDFRAVKAAVREIANRGNIFNGVALLVFYGFRFWDWGYYAARIKPARLEQQKYGKEIMG